MGSSSCCAAFQSRLHLSRAINASLEDEVRIFVLKVVVALKTFKEKGRVEKLGQFKSVLELFHGGKQPGFKCLQMTTGKNDLFH